jgi:hypothetical protein
MKARWGGCELAHKQAQGRAYHCLHKAPMDSIVGLAVTRRRLVSEVAVDLLFRDVLGWQRAHIIANLRQPMRRSLMLLGDAS